METEKEKTGDTISPEESAKKFWKGALAAYEKKSEDFLTMIRQQIVSGTSDPSVAEEEKRFTAYQQKLEELPANTFLLDRDYLLITHEYVVKPFLPWDRITDLLSDLAIDKQTIDALIYFLKPFPIETRMNMQDPLEQYKNKITDITNKKIKSLAPLVKRLENLSKADKRYSRFEPLTLTVAALRRDIQIYKAIVRYRKENDKAFRKLLLIDKDPNKSPLRHRIWREIATSAVKVINRYCHTNDCEEGRCRKTHTKAYVKVGELLKILYPTIWTQDIDMVNRIKSMEQRQG